MEQQSSDLVINPHNFEDKKNEMKAFAQSMPQEIKLSEFKTKGGLFNWGNHTVTGPEMNNFTYEIQKHLIESNKRDIKIAGQFNNVYETFETLDKDYIQKILISIKAAEAANKKASNAIKALKATTTKLGDFKSKIEAIEHLYDIDNMWDYCQKWQETISILSGSIERSKENTQDIKHLKESINAAKKQTSDLLNLVNQQIENIEAFTAFKSELETIVHLQDIDEMYDSLANAEDSLTNIGEELDSLKNDFSSQRLDVASLLSFMEKMSEFKHLNDIDDIWCKSSKQQDDLNELRADLSLNKKGLEEIKKQSKDTFDLVQFNKKNIDELHKIKHLRDVDDIWKLGETHSNQLSELEKKNEEINGIIQQNRESVDKAIMDIIEKNNSLVQILTKKIKYAYILAGGTLGIVIVELIVFLLKVI